MYGNGYGMNYMPYQNGAMHDVLAQYKGQYQQPMQNQVPMQPAPQMLQNQSPLNEMIWVQGEAGAKAYLVAPNTTIVLWDTESPTIYVKSADPTGKPLNMRILDFKERGTNSEKAEHQCTCGEKFVEKSSFEKLQEKYENLESIVKKIVEEKEKNDV